MKHSNRNPRRASRRAQNPFTNDSSSSFFSSSNHRRDQKTAQLCRQVFRALSLALGNCADDIVRDLVPHDVTPAPNASRLLVRVGLPAGVTPADALARLAQVGGFLRSEVAAAITRKRAPELLFLPIPTTPTTSTTAGEVPQ